MAKEEKTMWVLCASCGHQNRKHRILHEKTVDIFTAEDEPPEYNEHHRLVQCMGCETIKYVISRSDWFIHPEAPPWENVETDFKVYPDAPGANQQRLPALPKMRRLTMKENY